MREIGAIPDRDNAQRLADYLLTLGIATRLDQDANGWVVWVRDEDQLDRARRELEQFLRDPTDPRYQSASLAAATVRQQQAQREREFQKNYVNAGERLERQAVHRRPVTFAIIGLCLIIGVLTGFGSANEEFMRYLYIDDHVWQNRIDKSFVAHWDRVLEGQVWRLITPIFLHFGLPHIAFNLWAWYILGSAFEIRRGTWRLLLFMLLTAVLSNAAQYQYTGYPGFGGMSGIVYGLFGYIWIKSRFDPRAGLYMDTQNTVIMIGWLFLCMTGLVGNIANTAHVVGLACGAVAASLPHLWRWLRAARSE